MIVSLDIATCVGVCIGPVGAQPPLLQWGSRDFSRKDATNGEIIALFRGWVSARCFDLKPDLIVMESPYVPVGSKPGGGPPMNPHTLRRLLGMAGAVEAVCYDLKIPVREVVSAAFTKFMTGRGQYKTRPEKKAAVIAACRWFGIDCTDDNQADAAAIWLFSESIVSPRAADHRRRLAADRDRELNGSGPLFTVPEKENAPQVVTLRGVDATPGNGENPWDRIASAI
jgi:hypothetical protein